MSEVASKPWLSIVGIGENGLQDLSPAARQLIAQASLIVGGKRHLAMVSEARGERLVWPSPPDAAFPAIFARRGTPVCVLATGDPFFYGIGSLLARHVAAEERLCLPSVSAFSLAAARLGWALQECALVSLHGRALERIVPHLQPGARILALSWDGATPGQLAELLIARGMDQTALTICENMGGPRERLRRVLAHDFDWTDIDQLNTVGIEVVASRNARVLPISTGLPDEWFEHDGQITKRQVRAITLAALAPHKGELLWDIGAGSGSISIEWMLREPANHAISIECNRERAARIARNAAALGLTGLKVVEAAAPQSLAGLAQPDAVFVGGGANSSDVLDVAWAALPPGGRLVVNAVTLQTQAELTRRFQILGGDLVSINVAHAEPVGRFHGWRAAMPVIQWVAVKP
jgi:precorrin-6B C5,15-methyltransferase / cobalt-precorrin-6B C5,C15-methyltransferase